MRCARIRGRHKFLFTLPLAALLVLANGLFVGTASVADDGVQRPIETGEIKLREALCEALKKDTERYPFGEIECEITYRHLQGPVRIESARVHSWWLNDKSFTSTEERTTTDPSFIRSRHPVQGIQVENRSMEQTVSNNKILIVNKSSARAGILLIAKRHRIPNTSVTPAGFWFGKVDGEGRDWYQVLGPSLTTPVSHIKQYDAQKLPGERLLITLTTHGDPGSLRAVASLKQGKILSVDQRQRFKGADQRFSWLYTWSEDGKFLKSMVYRMRAGEHSTVERVYVVKKLDVVNKPDVSRFEIDETKLPSGYIIENKAAPAK